MATGTPNFAITPVVGSGAVTTGDTSRTAPTNKATVLTAGANGSRIERFVFCALGVTTASLLRLFVYNGSTYTLFWEGVVPAITPATGSLAAWQETLEAVTSANIMPMLLPSGSSIVASVNDTQAAGINVLAIGGNF